MRIHALPTLKLHEAVQNACPLPIPNTFSVKKSYPTGGEVDSNESVMAWRTRWNIGGALPLPHSMEARGRHLQS